MKEFSPEAIAWILGTPGNRLLRVDPLPPGATTNYVFEVARGDGSIYRAVLRQFHDAERLAHDPWYKPAREFAALIVLGGEGLPVPGIYAEDLHAEVFDLPSIVESWIPGAPGWEASGSDDYLEQAAAVLVRIHAVDFEFKSRYAPYREGLPIASPPFSTHKGLWERVAEALASRPPEHRDSVIHRDYHPGNVLWDGSKVTGVVDWLTVCHGPPGIDLARMRVNLALHSSHEAADRFTRAYVAAGGDLAARHPYWDLLDAADLLPDEPPGDFELDRLEAYLDRLLEELAAV